MTPKNFIDIARVLAGGSFGDLALIDGKQRFSTTKCLQRCHFLVIDKSDWKKAYDLIQNRKKNEDVFFIKNFTIFGKLSSFNISQRLMHYLYEMETVKDQIIIKEGD